MADSAESPLTPTKTSTVANLLGGVKTSFTNLFSSGSTASKVAGDSSSSSFLTNPLVWAGVVLAAGAVYLLKFRKPGRKSVKWRK